MQIVYLIDDDDKLKKLLTESFKDNKNYKFKQIRTENIDVALKDIPALIIVNEDTISENAETICNKIRNNDDNSITPIIVVTSNIEREHRIRVLQEGATYFIKNPIDFEYLFYTINNITNLLYLNRKVSPLTNLPGNVQIQAEIKRRLMKKEYFVMLYLDLDNFKAYNDVYGFSKISRNVHSKCEDNNFVGHIGGDDFIAIVDDDNFEEICQNIVLEFDKNIKKYFNEDDLKKGYLEVPNRKGIIEEFPLTTISVGAVEVTPGRFKNALEIGEEGAQVKHLAKTISGSTYVIDRRKNHE